LSAKDHASVVVGQFQSETAAIWETPEPKAAQLTTWLLGGFFVACAALALVTYMDRVVVSIAGKVVTRSELLNVFQTLDNSLIKSIDVREGDRVKAGQLLATLDQTFADADVYQYKLQLASSEAQIARDDAELGHHPLQFRATDDPDFLKYQKIQRENYEQRVAQYNAQIISFESKIRLFAATINKYEIDSKMYGDRDNLAGQIEQMRKTLSETGSGSQYNLWQAQDARAELARLKAFTQNSLIESKQQLAAAEADREAFVQQWLASLSSDLVQARGTWDTAKSQWDKAIKHQELVRLTAPEASVVLTLAKVSPGSVLTAGSTLFTLMPVAAPLEAEILLASRDIGFVRPGDTCILKIDAFDYLQHGIAEGKVRWVSEGAFTTDENGQAVNVTYPGIGAYYKARCSIESMQFDNVPDNFRLIPGMTLQGDIKIGKRSVFMYLLNGLLRGYNEAMREAR
jgi:HlyD family secretion protein